MPASPNQPDSGRTVTIQVNGTPLAIPAGTTVAQWIAAQELHPHQVAVEVNEELVPRDERDAVVLQAGDKVEMVTLVGGG